MAAIAQWQEDNGNATGSPAKGTTRANVSNVDWKSVDDTTTAYTGATIIAGDNSYSKYNFIKFIGSFNEINSVKFAHTAGTLGTGLSLKGKITSSYVKPAVSALSGSTDISAITAIGSGASVNLSTTGPEGSSSATLTASGYTQYIVTQLQTTNSAASGDIGSQTLTVQWNEN